jgi:hypothetical protein
MRPEEIYSGFQDHARFCRESLIVETEGRKLIPMAFAEPDDQAYSPGQIRLHEAIRKQRLAGRPVRIIYLKSRRIRATTGTAAHFFHDTAFQAGVHTIVLAHEAKSAETIFSIYERFYKKYKPFGGAIKLPPSRPLTDRIYFEYSGDPESSFIQVHTAGNVDFGRSFRITNVHFSEYPYYADSAATRAAIMSAVPKTADTCAIIEGTAKAIGDEFHKTWQTAIDSAVESEWEPIFLGCFEHPGNRMALVIPADRFQASLTPEERDLMGRHGLFLEQLAWRRWTIQNDFNGDVQRFRREHPATPEEAFTAGSRNRFSIPHIQRMPIQRQPMVGELSTEEVGPEKRIIFLPGEYGALRIYRLPEKGRCYAAGADPSGGADAAEGVGESDPDWAVCHILDRDNNEQCAVLRARLMPGEFGRYCNVLLRWYNNAQVCLERTGAGIGSLEALLNAGYPASLIYHRPMTPDQDPQVRSDKIGWETGGISREQLLSALDEAIRLGAIFVHDSTTQQELLNFCINARGKAEAQKGCHDDTVMALAMAVIVITRMPRPAPAIGMQARPQVTKYGQPVESSSRGQRVRLR